jgi:hypothetical protein
VRAVHGVGWGAVIDRALEFAHHHRQPLGKFGGDAIDQKRLGAKRAGAPLTRAQHLAIEDGRV